MQTHWAQRDLVGWVSRSWYSCTAKRQVTTPQIPAATLANIGHPSAIIVLVSFIVK